MSVLSAPQSARRWAHLDSCARHFVTTSPGVSLTRYVRCHGAVTVTLRTINGGTHVWGATIGQVVSAALGH